MYIHPIYDIIIGKDNVLFNFFYFLLNGKDNITLHTIHLIYEFASL